MKTIKLYLPIQEKNNKHEIHVICNFTENEINYDLSKYQGFELLITNKDLYKVNTLSAYDALVYIKEVS